MHPEVIDRVLSVSAAGEAASAQGSASTVRAMALLLAELVPLVGSRGTHALYARSLQLANSSFPRVDPTAFEAEDALAPLQADLASRAPQAARTASHALLNAFEGLLIALIGPSITHRMLCTAWGLTPAELMPEENQ